jgi:hypothetical protein
LWRPLPQSMMTRVSAVRTSTHDVLPPKRKVYRPGVGREPRVPQKRTYIDAPDGIERDQIMALSRAQHHLSSPLLMNPITSSAGSHVLAAGADRTT